MTFFAWGGMAVLMSAYLILARQPRGGALLIFFSDVLWSIFAVATGQLPLLLVSVWCGSFSLYTFVKWRDPALKPVPADPTPPPEGGALRSVPIPTRPDPGMPERRQKPKAA